jgi:hypothetical protein
MPHCFTDRQRLFSVTSVFGSGISAVAFRFFPEQILKLVPSSWTGPVLLFGIYLLPVFSAYLIGYYGNRFVIRRLAKPDLLARQDQIMRQLVDGAINRGVIRRFPADLIDEEAWITLRRYWRAK